MATRTVTDATIARCLALLSEGALSQVEIGLACGVSQGTVSLIKRGLLQRIRAARGAPVPIGAAEDRNAMDRLADRLHSLGIKVVPVQEG